MKKLSAVVMGDIVGYSKMMSFDEASALSKIKNFFLNTKKIYLDKARNIHLSTKVSH